MSAFRGQTGELRFFGADYLDFIQFSEQPIPEPSVFGLFALGRFTPALALAHAQILTRVEILPNECTRTPGYPPVTFSLPKVAPDSRSASGPAFS